RRSRAGKPAPRPAGARGLWAAPLPRRIAEGPSIHFGFFFKQKTAYEIGLGIPAEPLFRSDHRPEGDEKWFLENEKTVTQFCRKLAAERPLKDIRDEYNYPKKKGIKDECSRLLEASTMKSRRGFAIQRLMNAMRQAHAD